MNRAHNYKKDKENILNFLASFYFEDEEEGGGGTAKVFQYADQIMYLAQREQVYYLIFFGYFKEIELLLRRRSSSRSRT